eukprot:CAMPEP_0198265346 /NCGR_PEP_ID=MMETSP1447-20131203/22086_1 /TAXON_ID=420782 /ORGANISM="Chaetoceros dichaeta, Strain CCMP1751" /LENGTH=157 /DNA_ID=CAMNT_0043954799 /DNA_START=83 /DNA_END=553 /DNA_ORIENTATION=+
MPPSTNRSKLRSTHALTANSPFIANTLSADAPDHIRAIFDRCTFYEYSTIHESTNPFVTNAEFSPSISSSPTSDYSARSDHPSQANLHLMSDDEDFSTRSIYDPHHQTDASTSPDNLHVNYDDEDPLGDKNSGANFSPHPRNLAGAHHYYSSADNAH